MKKILSVILLVLTMLTVFVGCEKNQVKCAHPDCFIKPCEPYSYCSIHACKNPECYRKGIVVNSSDDDYFEDFKDEMERIKEIYEEQKHDEDFDEEDFYIDEENLKDEKEYKKIVRSMQGYCDKCLGNGFFR